MKSKLIIALLGISLLITVIPNDLAVAQTNTKSLQDVYVENDKPTKIPWGLTSVNSDYTESFYCDKTPNSTFKLGKTTVRCIEYDANGEYRSSFVVTVGYKIVQVPDWFKIPTLLWLDGIISDSEYFASVETMIQNGYMSIPQTKNLKNSETIPIWIYQNSGKWANGEITDDEFSIGIQWLIENGFIKNSEASRNY